MVHLHFLTLWFVIRKCHGYGSKPWEFWVVNIAILDSLFKVKLALGE